MTAPKLILVIALASQILYVGGELLFKAAMNHTNGVRTPWNRFLLPFLGGCAGIAGSFVLWLGLLAEKPLSFLYPLRSLNTVVIALGAVIFLHEKLTPRLILSIVLVTIGVGLVLGS